MDYLIIVLELEVVFIYCKSFIDENFKEDINMVYFFQFGSKYFVLDVGG